MIPQLPSLLEISPGITMLLLYDLNRALSARMNPPNYIRPPGNRRLARSTIASAVRRRMNFSRGTRRTSNRPGWFH